MKVIYEVVREWSPAKLQETVNLALQLGAELAGGVATGTVLEGNMESSTLWSQAIVWKDQTPWAPKKPEQGQGP